MSRTARCTDGISGAARHELPGTGIRELVERNPFQPRWPWISADLQTIRNFLPGAFAGIPPGTGERIEVPLRDGTGDRLVVRVHAGREPRPAMILVPGLTGCDASPAVLQAAAVWIQAGGSVLRLNLRGAPPGAGVAQSVHHMDRVSDLADACLAFGDLCPEIGRYGLCILGFSLGGAMALRLAGSGMLPATVKRIVSVSAPLDFHATANCLARRRNRLYERWLLGRMMEQSRHVWRNSPETVRSALARARHIRDFDDAFISGIAGFAGASEYYTACTPLRSVEAIRTPTLILHADDDPWVPPPRIRSRPPVQVVVSRGGGHVGFHGRNGRVPWHLQIAAAFFLQGVEL